MSQHYHVIHLQVDDLTWQESHEGPELQQRLDVVVEGTVGDAGRGGVGLGAAQLLLGHLLVCDGLENIFFVKRVFLK